MGILSEVLDQPSHLCSLIITFTGCSVDNVGPEDQVDREYSDQTETLLGTRVKIRYIFFYCAMAHLLSMFVFYSFSTEYILGKFSR